MSKFSKQDIPAVRRLLDAVGERWGGPFVSVRVELFDDGSGKLLFGQLGSSCVDVLAKFDGLGELAELLGEQDDSGPVA